MNNQNPKTAHSDLAAQRGEPSYVWRAGQDRRLQMILRAAEGRENGVILENGCGVGSYLCRLAPDARFTVGLEVELSRGQEAQERITGMAAAVVNAVGEALPFPTSSFDLILSHEVLEHVQNDFDCVSEMVRCLKPGGRLVLFVPNRWYPFETHGIFWKGKYHFGNKALVNYLPRRLRDRLVPHVNVYTKKDLAGRFKNMPVRMIHQTCVFGAYDNIIARTKWFGLALRKMLQWLEKTPLRRLGLSHFWVVEKLEA